MKIDRLSNPKLLKESLYKIKDMKNLNTQQTERLSKSIFYWFKQFQNNYVSLQELIESLTDWENYLKRKENDQSKNLWFKFFNGDTEATTIKDLENGLNPQTSTKENRELLNDKIEIALKDNSLKINFS